MALVLGLAGCGGSSDSGSKTSTGSSTKSETSKTDARLVGFVGVTAGGQLLAATQIEAAQMKKMVQAGVTSLRATFYWSSIEPKEGHFDWGLTDVFMAAAAKARLDVLPVLVGTPGWAAADPSKETASVPKDPAQFAAFAKAAVQRYGPDGSFWKAHSDLPRDPVAAWQIWNEPNHSFYWSKQPFAPSYVRLAKAAKTAITGADPNAQIVSAGFADRSWDLITQMEKAGGKGVFDVIATHPYTFEPKNVLRIIKLDRKALQRAGEGSTPLWATEVTWSSGKGKVNQPLGFETTAADQATRLSQALPLLAANRKALNLQRAYWESWLTKDTDRANPFDFSGLNRLEADGTVTPKPALAAFTRFAQRCRDQGC
jgi:hypothetical protein